MALGHDDAILMDGIAGVRRNHHIAGAHRGEQQVRHRVLGADGDDGLALRIEIHSIIRLVALGDLFAQFGNASRLRIAVIARITGRFHYLARRWREA